MTPPLTPWPPNPKTLKTLVRGQHGDLPFHIQSVVMPEGDVTTESLPPLSKDQEFAFDMMLLWAVKKLPADLKIGEDGLLTLGGYAGCLSGDTVVECNRGNRQGVRRMTLRDLYLKFNGHNGSGRGAAQRWNTSVSTNLYSFFPDGSVALNQIVAVYESGVKPVVRIDLSDGQHLVLTKDHPVATPSLEFVEAGSLAVGDVVFGLGNRKNGPPQGKRPLNQRPPRVIVNTKYHPQGYKKDVICNGVTYSYMRVPRARLVVEAEMNHISYSEFLRILKNDPEAAAKLSYLPEGVDVHHRDDDSMNDALHNLEVLGHAEHARHHDRRDHFRKEYTREVIVTAISEQQPEMTYDIQMLSPANNFAANGIFVHNTGKTTCLAHLAKQLQDMGISHAFCAYTGKAANVLRRKLRRVNVYPEFCGTIHSMMYEPDADDTGAVTNWNRRESLPYGLIIVDEASMVDEDVFNDLRSYGIPILAVGDHGQLPPVKGKFNLMNDPMLRLEVIHRQAKENPIIRLADYVRRTGCFPRRLLMASHPNLMLRVGRTIPESWLSDIMPSPAHSWNAAILTYSNASRVAHNQAFIARHGVTIPAQMIWLRNIKYDGIQISNGQRCLLVDLGPENKWRQRAAKFYFPDEGYLVSCYVFWPQVGLAKTLDNFDDAKAISGVKARTWPAIGALVDHGYSLTTHKAQGDQWDSVIVEAYRPSQVEPDDFRRWLYTSVTRAVNTARIVVGSGVQFSDEEFLWTSPRHASLICRGMLVMPPLMIGFPT